MEFVLESLVTSVEAGMPTLVRTGRAVLVAVASATSVIGCANHNDRSEVYLADLAEGRWDEAVVAARRVASSGPDRNEVIDALELGAVEQAAGAWSDSDASLGRAWTRMQELGDPGEPSFFDNLAAVAVNERALPYVGQSVDRTMCATLRALDLLAGGDFDSARSELKRAQFAQEDAERRFASEIADARERLDSEDARVDRIESSETFRTRYAEVYGDLADRFAPYRGWTVPFTDWLTAVLLLVDGGPGGDADRCIDLLRRVVGTVGENTAVAADLELAVATFESRRPRASQTWVVIASGFAPAREQVVFRIPAFIPEVPFIGVAFPRLVQSPYGPVEAVVVTDAGPRPAEIVCDMGSVVAQEFEATLPLITGRAVGAAVTKAVATLAANLAARQSGSDWAVLASLVATNIYGYATTLADLRTWRSLPRAWSVARIPTPEDGLVRLRGGVGEHEIPVTPGQDGMILVRCPRQGGPASVHAFTLDRTAAENAGLAATNARSRSESETPLPGDHG